MTQLNEAIHDQLFSNKSERIVLGSILIDPDGFSFASQHISNHRDFYLLRHASIWQAMERIVMRNENLDHVLVAEELEAMKELDTIGGRTYLFDMTLDIGTSIYIVPHSALIARLAERRNWLRAADRIKVHAMNLSIPIGEARGLADSQWQDAIGGAELKRGAWAHELADEMYDAFAKTFDKDARSCISTGLRALDDIIIGYEPSQLSIYAGRPGMGKSSAILTMALAACRAGESVPIFSSEMSKKQVYNRLVAMIAGVEVQKVKNGKLLTLSESHRVTDAFREIKTFNLFIDDTSKPMPRHIRAVTKLLVQRQNTKFILVDGIYIMTPNRQYKNQVEAVGSIVDDLRDIARTYDIHVAATHQLSRAVENRKNKRPVLSDLRDSGVVEQTADKIIFLYRDEVYNTATESPNVIDFIVAKHRDGETGTASAYFDGKHVRILNGKIEKHSLSELDV